MYNAYFRFVESPFSIAPDPRFVFMSARHREALAHLMYGLSGEGGFVVLTGEVGTGKTTICRCMLEQVPKDCDVAFMLNPGLSAVEMLGAICDELHIAYPDGLNIKGYVDRFNAYLLKANAAGRRTVVIIDEAQLLDPKVLELLRLLTNLETSRRKLLQIVLLGQPELLALLERPDLRQVAQRVVARYHLEHLSRIEVSAYVAHRLNVAGCQAPLIPEPLIGPLYRYTGGVPRLINLVCDRALLGTYVEGKQVVTAPILRKAASEVLGARKAGLPWKALAAASLAVLGAGIGWTLLRHDFSSNRVVVEPATPSRAASSADVRMPDPSSRPSVEPKTPSAPEQSKKPGEIVDVEKLSTQLVFPPTVVAEKAESEAFRVVLAKFGSIYSPQGRHRGCAYAETIGLRCYAGRGNTEVFRQYNPPLILSLVRDGERIPVVLDSMEGQRVTFVVAGSVQTATIQALEGLWTGEYQIVWRPPPGMPRQLQEGAAGPAVQWLSDALEIAAGRPAGARVDRFDGALGQRVSRFQTDEGLEPDGIAGPSTVLRLMHRVEGRLTALRTMAGAN